MLWRAKRKGSSFLRDRSGATMVEMTLLAPFLISLGAGVFEFTNFIQHKLLVEVGLRDAARYYARCRRNDTVAPACATAAQQIAVYGQTGAGPVRVTGWTTGDVNVQVIKTIAVTVDPVTGQTNYRSQSPNVLVVEVSSSFAYQDVGLMSAIGLGALNLSGSHQERVLGW